MHKRNSNIAKEIYNLPTSTVPFNSMFDVKRKFGLFTKSKKSKRALVVMTNDTKRDGRPIEQVGYYNPITKESKFDTDKIVNWLNQGVKPTQRKLK